MRVHEGGCLCGAVRYRLTAEPSKVFYCHCRMCQKFVGGPFFAAFTVASDAVEWQGEPRVWRSSDIAVRARCGTCGTPFYWQDDAMSDKLNIAIATLDDPNALTPREHFWAGEALQWPGIHDDHPRHRAERGSGPPEE